MNEEYVKELIDKADKSAFIIGMVYGGLTCIVSNLESNNLTYDKLAEEIRYLKYELRKNIENIYYQTKTNVKSHKECILDRNLEGFEFIDKEGRLTFFSHRTYVCLRSEKIYTSRELIDKTENELLKTPNLGRKSLNEIKNILFHLGLKLKE